MKKSKSPMGFLLLILLLTGVIYFGSPFLFLYGLRQDAMNGNEEQLREKVDFPKIREDIKAQVSDTYSKKAASNDNPISGLANAVAPRIAARLIDGLVTPHGIAKAVKTGKIGGKSDANEDKTNQKIPSVSMDWKSPNNVIIILKTKNESKTSEIGLKLERRGLIGWKLNGIKLPMDEIVK